MERLAGEPGSQAWAVRVRDRFGDAGVVGVMLCRAQGPLCIIDTFLLSCRVIGRDIEAALLWWVAKNAVAAGATHLVGEYIADQEEPALRRLLPEPRLRALRPGAGDGRWPSGTLYQLDLGGAPPPIPPWISIEANP